ncbi:glycoside hydrolase family 92 protein, partial [Lactarius akahatsu]
VLTALVVAGGSSVRAQPSPEVQRRITAAIKAAVDASTVDYTAFVNPFIGTDNFGDVCPGASVPFGMVKFVTDMTGYAPAGYVADATQFVRGLSPLHDSGTGSSLGTYGNFEIMPLICPGGFDSCAPNLRGGRERLRKNNIDDATPGYFSLTLDNSIQMEATSTRRAGLERFTFPKGNTPFFTLDLANDLPGSFQGGNLNIDPNAGRITIGGFWGDSFGPGSTKYQAFACYDLLNNGAQKLDQFGVWTGDLNGVVARGLGETSLNFPVSLIQGAIEAGALFSFSGYPTQVTIRVGVSFLSEAQACANAESEIGTAAFEEIVARSKALWNERLSRIEIDVPHTPPNVTELLYSSLYRASLTPNNATGEAQGDFADTTAFYFDSLYCSWDTFRTFYPLMSLHSPEVFAQIVDSYIDGYRKRGWMPECRANNIPGWTQGGDSTCSSGDVIVGHFAIHYHNEAKALGVDLTELYAAQLADAEVNPPEWNIQGRQSNVYNYYGYVPYGALDTSSIGRTTREGSRTLEYAFEDFAIRQVALLLNKADDEAKYANRSLSYRNIWDPTVESDGFRGFMQKRFPNGTFAVVDPVACSPNDPRPNRECSLQSDNTIGFYESSSWEYSWFVPHDMAYLITMMGGNSTFIKRLDHFFNAGYYLAGNEPSFQARSPRTPISYHYANTPASSVDAVRKAVFTNFDITPAGLPGNDDQAAMATLLTWHLLGLYPVPGTSELLVLSPMVPKYTVHNPYLNVSTTVTVDGFDAGSVRATVPLGAAAYVQSVRINNVTQASPCHFDFYDTFRAGADIVITVTADRAAADSCGASVPQSISTGGFATTR